MGLINTGLFVKMSADTTGLVRGLKETQRQVSNTGRVLRQLGGAFAGFFSIYAIGGIVRSAIRTNIEFEKSMANVRAITGATGKEFTALKNDAKRLGAATEFTASQVADLQVEYGRLGFSTQEILDATGATLDLATATGEELARSAEVAGATIRGFGLDAKETVRVTDVMARSFNASALNLDRFSESMKYVAPVARVAGVSLEETAAMMSVLADAGIHGSLAGTALRQILSEMEKTGKPLSVALNDLAKKGLNLADAEAEVGQRAKTALLVLTNQIQRLPELTEMYNSAIGASKNMADIQRDTVAGSLKKLQSAWDGLIHTMEDGNGVMQDSIDMLTKIVGVFTFVSNKWDYIKWLPVFLPARGAARAFSDSVDGLNKIFSEAQKLSTIPVPDWLKPETFIGVLAPLDDYVEKLQSMQVSPSGGLFKNIDNEIKSLKEQIESESDFNLLVELHRKLEDAELMAKRLEGSIQRALHPADGVSRMRSISATGIGTPTPSYGLGMFMGPPPIDEKQIQQWMDTLDELQRKAEAVAQAVTGALANMAIQVGETLGKMLSGEVKGAEILESLVGIIANFLRTIGTALITTALAAKAFKNVLNNVPAAIAVGVALIALSTALRGMFNAGPGGQNYGPSSNTAGQYPSAAQGGIVTGPTLAMVGDNRSGKEMLLPLERAGEIFGDLAGGQVVVLETRLRGTDIYLQQKRYNEKLSRNT